MRRSCVILVTLMLMGSVAAAAEAPDVPPIAAPEFTAPAATAEPSPTAGAEGAAEAAAPLTPEEASRSMVLGRELPEGSAAWGDYEGVLTQVIDADTVIINDIRFKLLGVNAPDRTRDAEADECYSQRSAKYLEELLLNQTVTYSYDRMQGPRGPHVAKRIYLFFDGRLINAELIAKGFAFAERKRKYLAEENFTALERKAYLRNIGLWHSCPVECDRSTECWTREW